MPVRRSSESDVSSMGEFLWATRWGQSRGQKIMARSCCPRQRVSEGMPIRRSSDSAVSSMGEFLFGRPRWVRLAGKKLWRGLEVLAMSLQKVCLLDGAALRGLAASANFSLQLRAAARQMESRKQKEWRGDYSSPLSFRRYLDYTLRVLYGKGPAEDVRPEPKKNYGED
jgi:hypothetical protein